MNLDIDTIWKILGLVFACGDLAGAWTDVTAGFGGTNTTVLFDLPATE